jgi:hypothetical protein
VTARAGRWAAVLLAVWLAPPAAAQEGRPGDPSDLINAVLGGLLGFKEVTGAELQQEVATIGGVPFRAPVPLDYLGPAQLQRYLKELFDSEYPLEKARADERTLVAFGLIAPGTPLRALRAKVLEDNVAGFYDERPDRKRLYAVSEDRTLTPANQIVLSHELRHALQDQYANVHTLLPDSIGDFDDRRMAYLTLLEGDATLVMERFLTRRLADSGVPMGSLSELSWPTPPIAGVPPVLRDQLVAPYVVGRDFARALQTQGGWDALRAAWSRPPDSTEQVLHPEKFFTREAPRRVALVWAPPGGTLVNEGVLGELLCRTLLAGADADDSPAPARPGLPGPDEVERAAAGWGGDLFRVWDVKGHTLLVWRSEWDRPEDAREFADTLLRRFEATHGPRKALNGVPIFARDRWTLAVLAGRDQVTLVSSDDAGAFTTALGAVGEAKP